MSRVESYEPGKSPEQLIEDSLNHPIGSPKLEELAKGKRNIVIISSDHRRPVPSKIITPVLLRRMGVPVDYRDNHKFMEMVHLSALN